MRRLEILRHAAFAAAAFAAVAWTTATALAAEWPTHPVRIVNTFAPGGAADILARMAADQLTRAFGQQFYVETRAGAGGAIGVDMVAHTPPDGYNFVITTLSLTAINPLINSKVGYDPFKDLTHVAYLAGSPIVFIVSAKSDIKTRERRKASLTLWRATSTSPRRQSRRRRRKFRAARSLRLLTPAAYA
jgi:tripartite-type tricarboxylate transporter receptor subunit TctC